MAIKAAILLGLGRLAGHNWASSRGLAVALCQGGEFAFVLFSLAADNGIMGRTLTDSLVIVVTLSMALTPLAFRVQRCAAREVAEETGRGKIRRPSRKAATGSSSPASAASARSSAACCAPRKSRSPRSTRAPSRSKPCAVSAAAPTTAMLRGSTCCAPRAQRPAETPGAGDRRRRSVAAHRRERAQEAFPEAEDLCARAQPLPCLPADGPGRRLT